MKNWKSKTKKILIIFILVLVSTFSVTIVEFIFANESYAAVPTTYLDDLKACDITSLMDCFRVMTVDAVAWMGAAMMIITSWFLGLSGLLLNKVLNFTIVQMRDSIYGNAGINTAWKALRDIANLTFIFILLYLSIATILNLSNINTKKLLARIIIIALLLNFSLFFTKIIIDASNIITIGFYNKIATATLSGDPSAGLAGAFMNKLGLTTFYNVEDVSSFLKMGYVSSATNIGKILLMSGFASILFIITAIVFLAACIMFIIRYVTFVFLMIFSPLAFAAMALPNDKFSSRWWNKLWDQAIFAPAFMAILWVVFTVLGGILDPTGTQSSSGGTPAMGFSRYVRLFYPRNVDRSDLTPHTNTIGLVLNFVIIITLIISSLIIAKELGAAGAAGGLRALKKLRGKAEGALRGTTGAIGRNTIGRAAMKVDKTLADRGFGNTAMMRTLRAGTTGALAKQGFGSKTGFKKAQEEKERADIKFANRQLELKRERASTKANNNEASIKQQVRDNFQKKAIESKKMEHDGSVKKTTEQSIVVSQAKNKFNETSARQNTARLEFNKARQDAENAKKIGRPDALKIDQMAVEKENVWKAEAEKMRKEEELLHQEENALRVLEEKENSLLSELTDFQNNRKTAPINQQEFNDEFNKARNQFIERELKASAELFRRPETRGSVAVGTRVTGKTVAGAAAGAVIGSAIPVVGTGIGAVVGGVSAGIYSYVNRRKIKERNQQVIKVMRGGKKLSEKGNIKDFINKFVEDTGINLGDEEGGKEKTEPKNSQSEKK